MIFVYRFVENLGVRVWICYDLDTLVVRFNVGIVSLLYCVVLGFPWICWCWVYVTGRVLWIL